MNDFVNCYITDPETKKVRLLNAKDVTAMHLKNVKYIKKHIDSAPKNSRVVVLTHHKPYNDSSYNIKSIDPAYSSDLLDIIKKPVVLWGYGHTHKADDKTLNGVHLYSNPSGYPRQKTLFNKAAVVKC